MKRFSRKTLGRTMVVIGCFGIVVAVFAAIVGVRIVGQVETSVDTSLGLTTDALEAVVESIQLTGQIVDTVQTGVAGIAETLVTVQASIDAASGAFGDTVTFLGGSLPDALDAVTDVLATVEGVANSIDSALRILSLAPFGPNYDPDTPFDEAIGAFRTALDPLPDEMRGLATDLGDVTGTTDAIAQQLSGLADDVTMLNQQLDQAAALVDRYETTAEEAIALANQSRDNLEDSSTWSRIVIVLVAFVFALGQIVPIWLGTTLIHDSTERAILARGRAGDETDSPPSPPS